MDKKQRTKNEIKGRIAEIAAIVFLSLKFYTLIKWRLKSKVGEIDLIFRKGRNLVFCEVKFRKSIEDAKLSITTYQQKRIIKAADSYAMKNPWANRLNWRYDAILITPFQIAHLKDAFRPE